MRLQSGCQLSTSNTQRSQKSRTSIYCATHNSAQNFLLLLSFALLVQVCLGQNSTTSVEQLSTQMPDASGNSSESHTEKRKVLHTIRRVLENYSDDAIRRIFGSTMIAPVLEDTNELIRAEFATTTPSSSTTNDHKFHDELEAKLREEDENSVTTTLKPKSSGVMRIRAGLRSSSSASTSSQQQNDERPLNRHYRSARHDWLQHHKRKRKGCAPLHGREQILCPTRNTHRYDVCISREQLCDHVVDCPGGEDESVEQCFFYKPLDDQLKTLSHAVLLLVDNIMADSEQRRQEL